MSASGLLLAVELNDADPRAIRDRAAAAEAAGFAFAVFGDGPVPPGPGPRIEAGTRAAYLARLTRSIGLAPVLHVTTTEPFHLATQLASLDHASDGRAAWVVGAANGVAARATVGAAPLDGPALAREIRDVIDVSRELWDSWEDDAVIRDAATGRFVDNDKVHHVRFSGASFSVAGPLITPRPPQGQVVVIASDRLGVAGRADITLVDGVPGDGPDGPDAVAARAASAREAGSPLVFADVEAAPGRPGELAGYLASLSAHVDGVLFRPAGDGFDALAGEVLPALAAAGLTRRAGPDGRTLRETLGLPRPASRFAAGVPDAARSAARA